MLGLFDKPVVIEGKRARKSTQFLVNVTTPTMHKEVKPLSFEVKINNHQIVLQSTHVSSTPYRILKQKRKSVRRTYKDFIKQKVFFGVKAL